MKSQFADLRAAQEARQARLAAVRAKERKAKLANGSKAFRHPETKNAKRGSTKGPAGSGGLDDDEFLPEDKEDKKDQTDGVHLSKEVQELMAK